MRIDAHHHLWRIKRGDYGWLRPETGPIYRDCEPADLAPILERHGIDRTILVQAAPTEEETRYLLGLAAKTPWIGGVVGWTDFEALGAPARIAALAHDPLLVGLRPMVQDLPDDDWLLAPALARPLEALVRSGLVFDALVLPHHLPRLLAVARRHPQLSIVIDHGAKPAIRDRSMEPWGAHLASLAELPNVCCKLSGLATEAAPAWSADDLTPYVDRILHLFGPDRVIWGSDWPVLELAGSYDQWSSATERLLRSLPPDARRAILGGNAARIYLSGRGRPC